MSAEVPPKPRRKRGPAGRAMRKYMPLLMMAFAVKTHSLWLAPMFAAMAYGYLWMIEDDAEEMENNGGE